MIILKHLTIPDTNYTNLLWFISTIHMSFLINLIKILIILTLKVTLLASTNTKVFIYPGLFTIVLIIFLSYSVNSKMHILSRLPI